MLQGHEASDNRSLLYVAREGSRLAGTTHLTISNMQPDVGGLGEVAVDPQFRRSGVATSLCERARDRFLAAGGKAVFLGTVNPEARRVYHRLGWRKLASATVMALVAGDQTPEEFLVDHFRSAGDPAAAQIAPGTPADRITMIPLLLQPHDWHVLDANTGHISTRYAVQDWCMSLYPHYESVRADGGGDWFTLRTDSRRLVGLSSARREGDCVRVDCMTHRRYLGRWGDLLAEAIAWAGQQGVSVIEAIIAATDEDKRARYQALGFAVDEDATLHRFQGIEERSIRLVL